MKILIFAGGAGTRLWPISRKSSPKQFEILKGDQSTIQMALERIRSFGLDNVYVSTNDKYVDLVYSHLPELDKNHIMGEPTRRDLAAAVGLALMKLKKQGVTGTIAMLWADHFMKKPENFVEALKKAEKLITKNPNRFVFLGETPRFANENLGWINLGENIEGDLFKFESWKYRPEILECQEMFESQKWMWNPGYFIFDIDFVLELYKKHKPEMYIALADMVSGQKDLNTEYAKLEAESFDNAIVEKIDKDQAVVIKVDLAWTDPGTLYALKEALVDGTDKNFEKGTVVDLDSTDSLILNEENGRLVATVGLKGMVVVNTNNTTLVCHKNDVPRIKELLKKIEEQRLEEYL
ncbi:MAG: sugar phosphate nucleotidyltransferase [Patescibacteria group bacterium]|nr:sugar phosphate nucleotidyltransferase [Patescibacteria group bacterium]